MASSPNDASVLPAMTLLATLSTAAEVRHAISERRAGRDPAAQEDAGIVRPFLYEARRDLLELLLRLRTGLTYRKHHDEQESVAAVRHFEQLMTLRRAERLLHLIHQRLLSLYPDVPESVLEDVRLLESRCARLQEADAASFAPSLTAFLEEALSFISNLREAL